MRLTRLRIDRLPGIDEPYEITAEGPGVHVVLGPNAVGKSSICRAVEALYWEEVRPGERTELTGEFEIDGVPWQAERYGPRVRWRSEGEDRLPPRLPPSRHRNAFILRLRDLLDPSAKRTRAIASEIRRQMSGGFDLAAIVGDLFPAVTRSGGRREQRKLSTATRAVEEAEQGQAGLARRAERRQAQMAELERCSASEARDAHVKRAAKLVERMGKLAGLVRQVTDMPAVLGELTGDELTQAEKFQEQVAGWDRQDRELARELDELGATIRDAGLAAPVDPADIATWREKADELGRLELELQTARKELRGEERKVGAALRSLGGTDPDSAVFTLDDDARLFGFLREAEENRGREEAVRARLALLDDVEKREQTRAATSRPEDLGSAVGTLRRWLRAPEPADDRAGAGRLRRWLLVVAGLLLAAGGFAAFIDPAAALLLAGAAAGLLAGLVLTRPRAREGSARADAEEAFLRLGLDPPESWDVPAVEARLRTLETDVADAEARARMTAYRAADRQHLISDLDAVTGKAAALAKRREELFAPLGLAGIPHDAELVDTAHALDQLRVARNARARAAGKVEELEETCWKRLAELAGILGDHGEPEPRDAARAKAYVGRLNDRNTELATAIAGRSQAAAERARVASDSEKARASLRGIYARASVEEGDLAGLRELIGRLDAFRELRKGVDDLESRNEEDRDALDEAGESELADLDDSGLRRLREQIAADADRAEELRNEIAELDAEVKQTTSAGSLEELIARRDDARTELAERRDAAILAEAGRFLIDAVEAEYEKNQMPHVFKRARNHFSAFTRHGYDLRVGRERDAPRLFAVDLGRNARRELAELSDGTRAQLLLAARVAFAEEVEGGLALPLFLDEALDQSDPARFDAIAASLGQIAADQGRQVFYLTSDPLDGERIRRALETAGFAVASEIDLGAIRGRATAVEGPSELRVRPGPRVPEPVGVTAPEYGTALGVPPFRPGHGPARQHFFYVLADDLELLRELLKSGVERAGQWTTVAGSPLASGLAARFPKAGRIDVRVQMLEVFCEVWSCGRGRPLDRGALAASGAVSSRYIDGVAEIARELDGDAAALLETIRGKSDARVRGFRRAKAEALEEHLRDGGYIDDRPVPGEGEVRLRVLASAPASELPGEVATELVDSWLEWSAKPAVSGP